MTSGGLALLIIDPQNDFHPPAGALGVPGAVQDTERTIAFLQKYSEIITEVIVTLDTHHKMHIAHAGFWVGKDGEKPGPFTIIESKDIKAGTWKAKQPEMEAWSLEYAQKLEAGGRFKICIWPDHCLMGTPGHAVYQPLADALNTWAEQRSRSVTWVLKGQNNRTEMYSAFKAEVELPDDPSTQLNTELISQLQTSRKVVCCGQAKSHCVNYTVRDLMSVWPKDRMGDIVVLSDGCSPVPGFEEDASTFQSEMIKAGISFESTSDFRCD
jgi:nicotinamidase-related amidase